MAKRARTHSACYGHLKIIAGAPQVLEVPENAREELDARLQAHGYDAGAECSWAEVEVQLRSYDLTETSGKAMSNTHKTVVACPSCGQRNSVFTRLLDKTNCGKCHQPLSPAQRQPDAPLKEVIEQLDLSVNQKIWLRSRLRTAELLPQHGGWFVFNIHSCTAEVEDLFNRGLLAHRKCGDGTQVRVSEEAIRLAFTKLQKQKEQVEPKEDSKDSASGVVYLIKAGPHHKIGKTVNLDNRFARLKIQLPYKPEIVHSIKTNNIHKLEKHWHRRFASQRANGEWFELSAADVTEFVEMKHVRFND